MAEAVSRPLVQTKVSGPVFDDAEILELAEKYGTPLYIIDEPTLRLKLKELKAAFSRFRGELKIAYSMKANFNPSVLRVFIEEGTLFDIATIGELYFFTKTGGKPENVIYTSVTEGSEELLKVIQEGVGLVVVSSSLGLTRLERAAKLVGKEVRVLVRINPEVGVKAGVRASYRHGKFGVPFNTNSPDSATALLRRLQGSEHLLFEGFHFHLGSQIEDPSCFSHALEKLEAFILKMRREMPGLTINTLDIGGGTPIFYGTPVPTADEIGELICARLNQMLDRLQPFTLVVESGRYLAAESSILISKVVNTKRFGDQLFLILDVGYHLLLDAALLHQSYPQVSIPMGTYERSCKKIQLVGMLCDTRDVLPISAASQLNGCSEGHYVVFRNVGAYSLVFNMPFHCQTKPPVLMRFADKSYSVVREGQSIEKLYEEEGGLLIPHGG